MRIALVSPYSWSYPGGVTRHIEALAEQFLAGGHHVRVLAPYDPPDRLSARMHRGARPEARELPDWVIPLGRTIGVKSNGAVSNLPHTPYAITTLRRELRAGGFDVIHAHEPVAPVVGYDVLDSTIAPLVGTFHCYSENVVSNTIGNGFGAKRKLQRLHVRIAVSEAAAWTGRRFYGGSYRIIPNGVDVPAELPISAPRPPGAPLRLAFVGQAVERKGLPVLLRAFEALRDHVPVELIDRGRRSRRGRAAACSTARRASPCWARSPTPRRPPRWPPPTCSSRPRWAARASAWSSPRPSPPAHRSSPPTSPATATSCATGSTACSSRAATPPPSPRPFATSRWRPGGAPRWPSRRERTRRATPGRRSPARCWRPTPTPSPCRARRPPASAPASSSAPCRPTSGRACPPSVACRASRPPSARVAIAAARPPARPGSASPGSPPRSWPCSR